MKTEDYIKVAQEFGTPCYLYYEEKILNSIAVLKNGIGKNINLFYSVKANPNKYIINTIKNSVEGFEVCSIGEMMLCKELEIDFNRLIFVGPGKTVSEIKYAINNGIKLFVVESKQELDFIDVLANKKVDVLIRINPQYKVKTSGRLNMAGKIAQFGFDEQSAIKIISKNTYRNILIKGIHFYFGTQNLKGDILNEQFIYALNFFNELTKVSDISILDFGGGFGIPYFANEKPLDFNSLSKFKELINKDIYKNVSFIMESGRYIVAESGCFIVKVLYTKYIDKAFFAIVDGGFNSHFSLASIGRLLKRDFPVEVINNKNEIEKVTIVGPLCTPVDVIARDIYLPKIIPGDFLLIKNSGAYGYTYSPQLFLSHPTPIEVIKKKAGDFVLIRKSQMNFIN